MCLLHDFINSTIAAGSSIYQPALHVAIASFAELNTWQALQFTALFRGPRNARKTEHCYVIVRTTLVPKLSGLSSTSDQQRYAQTDCTCSPDLKSLWGQERRHIDAMDMLTSSKMIISNFTKGDSNDHVAFCLPHDKRQFDYLYQGTIIRYSYAPAAIVQQCNTECRINVNM